MKRKIWFWFGAVCFDLIWFDSIWLIDDMIQILIFPLFPWNYQERCTKQILSSVYVCILLWFLTPSTQSKGRKAGLYQRLNFEELATSQRIFHVSWMNLSDDFSFEPCIPNSKETIRPPVVVAHVVCCCGQWGGCTAWAWLRTANNMIVCTVQNTVQCNRAKGVKNDSHKIKKKTVMHGNDMWNEVIDSQHET